MILDYSITIGVIICIVFLLMYFCKKNFSYTLTIVVGGIIFILYGFGLLGKIIYGIYLIYGLAIIGLVIGIYGIINNKIEIDLFKYDIIIFLIGCIIIFVVTIQMKVSAGDEFTHWGSVVKNMLATNKLSFDSDNWLYFPDYLPGTAVFQYFFSFNKGLLYSESNLYRAMDILLLAGYLPILSYCRKEKNLIANILITVILLLLPMLFMPKTWLILQVDSLLIILFANILLTFRFMYEDAFKYVYLGTLLVVLVLVKESGLALGIFSLLYMLLFQIVKKEKRIKILLVYLFLIFIISYTWKKTLEIYTVSVQRLEQKEINLYNIWKFLTGSGKEEEYEIARRFFHKFTESTMGSSCSFYVFVLFIFLFPILIVLISKNYNIMKIEITIVGCTFFSYSIYLLFMYLFMWDSNIGLDVTSFWRYMGTLIGAWLLYFVSEMYIYLKNSNVHTNKIVIIAVILCMFFIIPIYDIKKSFIPLWGNVISTGREQRNNYLDSEQFAGMLNWKEDKVYIVSQFAERSTTNYLDYWITRFNIAPVKTNEFPSYSFNDTGNDKNRNYVDMTTEEWEKILLEDAYSFVYIYAIDEGFIEEFGGLFEDKIVDKGLFRVSRLDGSVKLIRVYR